MVDSDSSKCDTYGNLVFMAPLLFPTRWKNLTLLPHPLGESQTDVTREAQIIRGMNEWHIDRPGGNKVVSTVQNLTLNTFNPDCTSVSRPSEACQSQMNLRVMRISVSRCCGMFYD